MIWAARRVRTEEGQATVEFALVLPVLAVIIVAIIQFGGLYNHYVSITDGARAGARLPAVSRTASNPVAVTKQAILDSLPALDPAKLGVTVTPSPPWTSGQQVTVTATYPYKISLLGMVVKSGRLSSSTTERVE